MLQQQWQVAGSAPENYERYLVPSIFGPWARELVDLADPRPGERILDVACGTGIVARLAAERIKSGQVVGLDINPGMITVARSIGPNIEWHEGNALEMSLADGSFDIVFCQACSSFPTVMPALGRYAGFSRRADASPFVAGAPSTTAPGSALFS
jgi:SAM-dependent methyltransferase